MVKKLYLDGCSLTYGQGLDRDLSLGSLFKNKGKYDVLDMSRPGKSNIAIALDIYNHCKDFDVFVIGWTFSSRFSIKYQGQDIDFFAGFDGKLRGFEPGSLDQAYNNVYKFFYTVFEPQYYDNLSNFIIDSSLSFLAAQKKEIRAFSWEQRDISYPVTYPYIGPTHRLNDGHLNSNGVKELYHFLQNIK
jgi:hypothetical protein